MTVALATCVATCAVVVAADEASDAAAASAGAAAAAGSDDATTVAPPRPRRQAEDPEVVAVKAAAKVFLSASADGDEAKARELFAGDEAEKKLLDATLKAVASSRRFRTAIEQTLKADPEWTKVGVDAQLRRTVEELGPYAGKVEFDKAAGEAILSPSHPLDAGLRLRKAGADWKVIALAALTSGGTLEKHLAEETAAFEKLAAAVGAGKFERWEDAMRALAGEFELGSTEDVIEPEDPRAASVRMAAREFLNALADDDAGRARSLFAGDDEQRKVLDAYFAAIDAGARFRKALVATFGDRSEFAGGGISAELRATARLVPIKVMAVGPDTASMSPGIDFDRGLAFRRVEGEWRVSALTSRPDDEDAAAQLLGLLRGTGKVLADVAGDLEAARVKDLDGVTDTLRERMEPLLAGGR